MSNKTESKGARRRGLATRIMAWILSILMMGSMITTRSYHDSGKNLTDRRTARPRPAYAGNGGQCVRNFCYDRYDFSCLRGAPAPLVSEEYAFALDKRTGRASRRGRTASRSTASA